MIILASQSPRRAELLSQLKVEFSTCMIDVDESIQEAEQPTHYVTRLAELKARTGWSKSKESLPVLGSDTIVVLNGEILGKPKDQADSVAMLQKLSGREHQVMTAVAVVKGDIIKTCLVVTDVVMKSLTREEIDWYWQTGEPQDKAGSYGIQGLAGRFITHINGSYSAVVGLPLYETSQLLQEIGMELYER